MSSNRLEAVISSYIEPRASLALFVLVPLIYIPPNRLDLRHLRHGAADLAREPGVIFGCLDTRKAFPHMRSARPIPSG